MKKLFLSLSLFILTLACGLGFVSLNEAQAGLFEACSGFLPLPCAEGEDIEVTPPPPGSAFAQNQVEIAARLNCNTDNIDPSQMGFNSESCFEEIAGCEQEFEDCLKATCEYFAGTGKWHCLPEDTVYCSHTRQSYNIDSACQKSFLDAPERDAEPENPYEAFAGMSDEELQDLRDYAALVALTPEQRQQLRDLAALAALTPEEAQQLRDLAALGALTPEQAQELRDLAALAALTPDQAQQLRDLAALAALSPDEQEQLRDYAAQVQAQQGHGPVQDIDPVVAPEPNFEVDHVINGNGTPADGELTGSGGCTLASASGTFQAWYLLFGCLPLLRGLLRRR